MFGVLLEHPVTEGLENLIGNSRYLRVFVWCERLRASYVSASSST